MDGLFNTKQQPSVISLNRDTNSVVLIKTEEPKLEERKSFIELSEGHSLQEILATDYDVDRRHFRSVFILINIMAAIELVIIVYILSQWLDGFNWHPDEASASDFNIHLVCTVLSCIIFDAYGILIFRAFPNYPHRKLAIIHTVIMIVVVLLAFFGIKIAYDSHHIYGNNHLYSLHSWMGVTIFGLLFFELVTGNWLFFNKVVHGSLRYWHTAGGLMVFFISLAATVSGILTAGTRAIADNDKSVQAVQNMTLNLFGITATFFFGVVRYLYVGHRFRRRPRPGSADEDLTEQETVLAIVRNISNDDLIQHDFNEKGPKEPGSAGSSSGDPGGHLAHIDSIEENQIAWLRGHSQHVSRTYQQSELMGSDEDPKEYDRCRILFKNGLVVAEITGVLSCFLIIFWIYEYAGGAPGFGPSSRPINLHVILMVLFMFYLHGHAALIYRIFPERPKYTVKLIHAGLHLTVCISVAVGLAAAVEHHDRGNGGKGVKHFYSFHSWLGLTSIIVYYGQFLVGFVAFLLPTTSVAIRAFVLPIHRICGQAVFSFSTGSIVTGVMLKAIGTIDKDYSNLPSSGMVINFGGFFALLFSIAIASLVGDHRFRRRPRPEGELLLTDAE